MPPPPSPSPPLLSVEGTLTGEKLRGAVASFLSGSTASVLTLYGVAGLGMSAPISVLIFTYALGGLLGYSLDILLAKRDFGAFPEAAVAVPYLAVGKRVRWLLRSFGRRYFFRFVVTVIIETLTSLAMLAGIVRAMDANGILTEWGEMRNAVVAIAVAFVNFWLFGNVLRFDWAYRETEHPVLNVVVLMWLALAMLVFASSWRPSPHKAATPSQ